MRKIIADCHHDLLLFVERKRNKGKKNVILNEYYDDYIKGGFNLIVSSIFISDEFIPEMALRKAMNQISALYEEMNESGGKIALCTDYKQILEAVEKDKIAIMLSLEGLDPIYNDLTLIRIFFELGVRFLGLTWSRRNYVADGCFFASKKEGKKGGLTDFGVKVMEKASELGMVVDLSHINDEGFEDVIKYFDGPIIASHSNSRELVGSMRNLTDKQIKTINDRKGIIGLNSANIFTGNCAEEYNTDALAEHLIRISEVGSENCVSLGLDICEDFDMDEMDELSHTSKFSNLIPRHSKIEMLENSLKKKGKDDEFISKAFGNNFIEFIKRVF